MPSPTGPFFSLPLEHAAAEITAALKVVADTGITDAHWPMACADMLCAVSAPALADEDASRLRGRYGLTIREIEVTRLLLRGESNREIADRLNISEHTARHHTENVLGKLGVRSRAAISRAVAPQRSSGPFRGT